MSGLDHGEDVSAGSQLHFEAEMLSMSWQPAEQRRHSEGPSDFPNELDEQDEDMVVDPSVAVLDAQDDFRPIPVHWKIEKSFVAPFTHTCRSSNFGLPAYIRCTTRRYTKDQIDVLSQGGAMSIPERSARDALVHAFTFYVFPTMPILHLSDFLAALDTTQGAVLDSQVSLLLFQAVMFAGTAHVNLTVLHQLGFTDRTSARAAFFMKVKLLYDLDWESDRIVIIQTILLYQTWYMHEDEYKDPWHWLGIAIDLCKSVGIDRPDTYANQDAKTCRLWRRLWWSCILRDRIIVYTMRKPTRIRDEDIYLSRLQITDFNLDATKTRNESLRTSTLLGNAMVKVMTINMFLAELDIFLIIGRILATMYVIRIFKGSTTDFRALYSPKRGGFYISDTDRLQNEISAWWRNLGTYCHMEHEDGEIDDHTGQALRLQRAVLKLCHLSAQESIFGPLTLTDPLRLDLQLHTPREHLRNIAQQVGILMKDLQAQDLTRFLPPLVVASMWAVLTTLLKDFKMVGPSQHIMKDTGDCFQQCMRTLLVLREMFPIANGALFGLGELVRSRQVHVSFRTLRMAADPDGTEHLEESDCLETSWDSQPLLADVNTGFYGCMDVPTPSTFQDQVWPVWPVPWPVA